MFISSTKRNPYDEVKISKDVAPVVQYDDRINTINYEKERKSQASSNPHLNKLRAQRGLNPGFSSNAPRFNEKKVDEPDTFLGPGYYEQQSAFDPSKSVGGVGAKGQKFLSQAERFNHQKKGVEIPGPGHYSSEDLNSWFKRSYNMIFTE